MANDPSISSDTNAFLGSYWADLHRQSQFFQNLAPELQTAALADAIAPDHPTKAAEIREWNVASRRAMIAWLDQARNEPHTARQTQMWGMQKGARRMTCVAVYLPTGIDLRLLEGEEMRRTELFRDAPTLTGRSRSWQHSLATKGWQEEMARHADPVDS